MRWIVVVAAVEAAATSLILILSPFARLADTERPTVRSGAGTRPAYRNSPARIRTGLLASARGGNPAVRALLIYNLLATIYLLYLGVGGKLVGMLLWPAVALHAILTILVTRVWRASPGY